MNSKKLLYGLVNALYYLLIASSIFSFLSLPFGKATIRIAGKSYHEWNLQLLILLLFCFGGIVLLVLSINNLRKASKLVYEKGYFNEKLSPILDKSGRYMTLSGLTFLLIDLIDFFIEFFTTSALKLIFDTNVILLLLLLIFGTFLKIQANTLKETLLIKSENDLTI